jgi:hypothetical protein
MKMDEWLAGEMKGDSDQWYLRFARMRLRGASTRVRALCARAHAADVLLHAALFASRRACLAPSRCAAPSRIALSRWRAAAAARASRALAVAARTRAARTSPPHSCARGVLSARCALLPLRGHIGAYLRNGVMA